MVSSLILYDLRSVGAKVAGNGAFKVLGVLQAANSLGRHGSGCSSKKIIIMGLSCKGNRNTRMRNGLAVICNCDLIVSLFCLFSRQNIYFYTHRLPA